MWRPEDLAAVAGHLAGCSGSHVGHLPDFARGPAGLGFLGFFG